MRLNSLSFPTDALSSHSTLPFPFPSAMALGFLPGFPQTNFSTSPFSLINASMNPLISVSQGRNIETRLWYALYVTGYFLNEMLSVYKVDPMKRQESAIAGKKGCKPSRADSMFAKDV